MITVFALLAIGCTSSFLVMMWFLIASSKLKRFSMTDILNADSAKPRLTVYLMEREHKHQADPAFDHLAEEETWRSR